MANSHLKTAHDHGVQKALEAVGYKSTDEVIKEARDLGLLEQPQQKQASAPTSTLDELFKTLGK